MPLKKKFGGLGPTMLTLMQSRGKIMPRTVFFVNFLIFLYVLLWEGREGGGELDWGTLNICGFF